MIEINRITLANGLRLIHHFDSSTSMVAINTLYNVGSRDEQPHRTGFAHLFEHLMFEGSKNIADFDTPLQLAGGENNAWTSNDITNYYTVVPHQNVETAFWLESDRMVELAFSQKSLDVQKQVVIEEFKQRNLNQPYGDQFHLLRPLAYPNHPYGWSVIGKEVAHIETATLNEVKEFFFSHYAPNNAILSIAGNITWERAVELTEKWYGGIPAREIAPRNYAPELPQKEPHRLSVERDVPNSMITKAYHMCSRMAKDYHSYDLLSDILSNGRSSRLHQQLVVEQQLFSEIDAYLTGDIEEGLFVVTGKPMPHLSLEEAEEAIVSLLQELADRPVDAEELEKVVNKNESNRLFGNTNYLNVATNLAYYEVLGDAEEINREDDRYKDVTPDSIQRVAREMFCERNCSTLYYKAKG